MIKTCLTGASLTILLGLTFSLISPSARASSKYEQEMAETVKYFREGNIQAAFKHCNNTLKLKPDSTDALLIRGWLLLNANRPERAIDEFNKVLKIDPDNVNACKSRGLVYRQIKEFEKANQDLDRALKLDPTEVETNYLHGIGNVLDGNHKGALVDLDRAIKYGQKHPRLNHLYYWRGRTRQMAGDHKGAVSDLSKCGEISRSNSQKQVKPEPKYRLSNLFFKVALYTQKADSVFGRLERAASYMELGEYEKAAQDYTSVMVHNPDDTLMYEERGVAYLLGGQYQKALKDFNKALLGGSPSTDLYLRMAVCQFCQGNYKRTPSTLKTWFSREGYVSEYSPLAISLAYTSYIRTRQFKEAHLFLVKVGKKIPANESWHRKCYLILKKSICCGGILKESSDPKQRNWARVHVLPAIYYTLKKKPEKAVEEFKQVMKSSHMKDLELAVARSELKRIGQ